MLNATEFVWKILKEDITEQEGVTSRNTAQMIQFVTKLFKDLENHKVDQLLRCYHHVEKVRIQLIGIHLTDLSTSNANQVI